MSRRKRETPFQPLRRATGVSVWADGLLRLAAAFFLVFIVIMVHWADRNGLKDRVSSTGHRNTLCSLPAGVSKSKVFRGR